MFVLLGDRMNGRRVPHTIAVFAIFVVTFLVTPIHAHSAPPTVGSEGEPSSPGFPAGGTFSPSCGFVHRGEQQQQQQR